MSKQNIRIKGNSPEDVANSRSNKLKIDWETIKKAREDIKRAEDFIIEKNMQVREQICNLRNEEACNVIAYIRSRFGRLSINRLDVLLCHCKNMLNGNIDGIILDFSEEDLEDAGA